MTLPPIPHATSN